jgi:hypothetical protein
MIMGIRCSNTDYSYVLISGRKEAPVLGEHESVHYPEGFKRHASLKWMVDEIRDKARRHGVDCVVIKGTEPAARPNAELFQRVEYEAAVLIACAEVGLKAVFKKVKSTIAKDLGMKGRPRYLATFDTSPLMGYDDLPSKGQEAALAAWSELN